MWTKNLLLKRQLSTCHFSHMCKLSFRNMTCFLTCIQSRLRLTLSQSSIETEFLYKVKTLFVCLLFLLFNLILFFKFPRPGIVFVYVIILCLFVSQYFVGFFEYMFIYSFICLFACLFPFTLSCLLLFAYFSLVLLVGSIFGTILCIIFL